MTPSNCTGSLQAQSTTLVWLIPKCPFEKIPFQKEKKEGQSSPFKIGNLTICIGYTYIQQFGGELLSLWLENYSRSYTNVKIIHHSFSIGGDSEDDLKWMTQGSGFREINGNYKTDSIHFDGLSTNSSPDGSLRVWCKLKFQLEETPLLEGGVSISENLSRAWKTRDYYDAVLVCGAKEIPVHRFILSARSPVFKAMFLKQNCKKDKTRLFLVKDINPEALLTLVIFAYTDQVKSKYLTLDVLSAAFKYDLPILFNECQLELRNKITIENASQYFVPTYLHSQARVLRRAAAEFICKNFDKVKKTPKFALISEHPAALLELLDASTTK